MVTVLAFSFKISCCVAIHRSAKGLYLTSGKDHVDYCI